MSTVASTLSHWKSTISLESISRIGGIGVSASHFLKRLSRFTGGFWEKSIRRPLESSPIWVWGIFHLKQYDKAIERHREAWIGLARILGPDDTATLTVQSGIGVNLRRKGEFEEAYRILEDVYVRGRRDANYDFFRTEFLEACIKAKKTERIKKLALEQYELSSKRFEKGSFDQSNDLVFAWSSLRRIGAWEDAEPILQESLEIMNRLKPDQWETFDRQSQFGECLVKTKKFDEAKEWLFSGHEGLKATFDDMPDNMKAKFGYSLDRIVEFYIATGDEALAADWQQKLDAFNLKMKENPSWR